MRKLQLVEGYKSVLSLRDTEKAIKLVKDTFEKEFAKAFCLERISAPMFVEAAKGLNDDLSGTERPVKFDILEIPGMNAEIVHSLAKWKRVALKAYGFADGEGIYTDMNAIRRDDSVDNIHSIYVDQWDWERIITAQDRTEEYLKNTVSRIVQVMAHVQDLVRIRFPEIDAEIERNVHFITAQELEDMYPGLSGKEREHAITKKYKTVFIMKIGGALAGGKPHDGRAPDYDDWQLNGDILVWNEVLGESLELSSMGIRVDAKALAYQLKASGKEDRLKFDYHQDILNERLPLTIGGGIGQSRLCMVMLKKLHIGEVQVSLWPKDMREECERKGVKIL